MRINVESTESDCIPLSRVKLSWGLTVTIFWLHNLHGEKYFLQLEMDDFSQNLRWIINWHFMFGVSCRFTKLIYMYDSGKFVNIEERWVIVAILILDFINLIKKKGFIYSYSEFSNFEFSYLELFLYNVVNKINISNIFFQSSSS